MPRRPDPACPHPRCGRIVAGGGRCAKHKRKRWRAQDRDRGSAACRLYDRKWRKARAPYLAEYPLCVAHQAKDELVAATVVDHIEPRRMDLDLL